MIGSLTKCIAEFLRNTEVVKENSIPVYTANTVEGRFTVNTSLPAILVTVAPSENPTVFISGNILDSIIIHIRYMDDLLNYTMSEDDGIYEERRNWAYLLRDELWNGKQSSYFKQFMNVNGLNIMYKGMSTYTQVGVLENLSKDIDVFSFIFSCNLFSDQLSIFPTVPLEEFFITLEGAHGEPPEPTFPTVRASGGKFVIWNSVEASDKVKSCSIHGKSYQDGTPTPLAPVEILSVGDNSLLLQIGDSKDSVNHTIDIKKAIQDAEHDGILRSVNGIYDEVVYNGKEWKLIKRIQNEHIITCTGVSNHTDLGFCDCYFYPTKAPINGSTPNGLLSTHFVQGNNGVGTINLNNNSPYLGIFRYPTTVNMTKEEITAWLGENEVYVSYQLAEPAEYPLDLPVIPTYSNETWISTKKENVNPRIVMDCEVSEILDYIRDGLIGYYTGRGRSNTDENKNILPDLSGNGNDLENKNFAYTPESGYGDGYIQYDGVDDFSNVAWTDVTTKSVLLVCEDIVNTKQSPYYSLTSMIGNDRSLFGGISNGKIPANNIYGYFNSSNLGSELYTKDFSLEKGILNIYLGNTGGLINNPEYVYNLCIGAGNFYANPPRYSCKVKIYDFLAYTRKLTDEEIEHNYKASLQYNGMTL